GMNEKTNKRDIYRLPLSGGLPQNLTNTPDIDECDAVWNKFGNKIAFASDRSTDEDKRPQYDIWVIDVSKPESPERITSNASWDDCPAWDPSGNAIYFRSNRGG